MGDNATVWADYNDEGSIIRIGLGEGWVQARADYRKSGFYSWRVPQTDDNISVSYAACNLEEAGINFAPLILGAYRRIEYKEIEGMKKEALPAEKRKYYRGHSISSTKRFRTHICIEGERMLSGRIIGRVSSGIVADFCYCRVD